MASIQPSTGTSSTSGAAVASPIQSACETAAASTAIRRAPADPTSRGQAPGRSYPISSTIAPAVSRPACTVYRESVSTVSVSVPRRNRPEWPETLSSPSASVNPVNQRMCSRLAPK